MAIVGILVVIGGVIGGFMIESGKMGVLVQPAEVVVIFGAAIGGLLVSVPISTPKDAR